MQDYNVDVTLYTKGALLKRGFTILELTFALALIALLSGIVLSKATTFIDAIEVRGAVTEVESLFATARHVAIARATQSTLDIDPAGGIILVHVGNDTIQLRELARVHGVTMSTTRSAITYSPTGLGYGAANLTLTIARNLSADTIYVSRLGRVRH